MDMDMSGPQKTALMNAHTDLQGAVNALVGEATQDEVNTAKTAATALQNAINAATDVAASDLTMYRNALTNANNAIGTAQNLLTTQGNKEMTAMAKALKAAIGAGRPAGLVVTPTSIPAFDLDGDGTGTDESAALTLKKGASVGSLGSWTGTDYAGEAGTGDAKTTGMVRVYSNQGAAKRVTFASEAGAAVHGWSAASGDPVGDYTVVTTSAAQQGAVGGFPTTGTSSYEDDDTVPGTFMKASGTYECTAAGGCTAAVTADGVDLGSDWTFTPAPGATLQQPDANYLRFGWWVRKDKDGPTHAGVFSGPVGTTVALTDAVINNAALVGKATYTGSAAGKFAISNTLQPAGDNSGHFTANAKLEADFKVTGSTLSGTIDAFRLNDGSNDPGWSVELQKTQFTTPNFASDEDATTADITVWSINDAKGAASGEWQAQMFDESATDGSNVPTSVVGSFESSISTTHSMIGAFGATKDD